MCYDLIDHGCVPQKTFKVRIPTEEIVPKKFMRDFLRGFFDGDGCICTSIMSGNPHIELSLTGVEDMLSDISSFLIKENVIQRKPKIHHDKRSGASSIFFYGYDNVKKVLDYLYKGSKTYLNRKYEKYMVFYKDYKEPSHPGVYWSKRNGAYIASISINGTKIGLGQSHNLEEAIRLRKDAEKQKYRMIDSQLGQQ